MSVQIRPLNISLPGTKNKVCEGNKTSQTIKQFVAFSVYLASVRRNQKVSIEKLCLIELNTWTGCLVMQKKEFEYQKELYAR